MQLVSAVLLSASPAASPRLLIWLTAPLGPPSVASGVITPFCHTKGRHWKPLPKAQKFSLSLAEVSAPPTAWPKALRPTVILFGPPRPCDAMSIIRPLYQRTACCEPSATLATPPTKPLFAFP